MRNETSALPPTIQLDLLWGASLIEWNVRVCLIMYLAIDVEKRGTLFPVELF